MKQIANAKYCLLTEITGYSTC